MCHTSMQGMQPAAIAGQLVKRKRNASYLLAACAILQTAIRFGSHAWASARAQPCGLHVLQATLTISNAVTRQPTACLQLQRDSVEGLNRHMVGRCLCDFKPTMKLQE